MGASSPEVGVCRLAVTVGRSGKRFHIVAGEILNGNPNEKKLKAFAEKY